MVEGLFNSNSSREEMIIIIYGKNSSGKDGRFRRLNTRKVKTRMNSVLARLDEGLVY